MLPFVNRAEKRPKRNIKNQQTYNADNMEDKNRRIKELQDSKDPTLITLLAGDDCLIHIWDQEWHSKRGNGEVAVLLFHLSCRHVSTSHGFAGLPPTCQASWLLKET